MVSESRPLNEGVILARQLAEWHILSVAYRCPAGPVAAQADLALLGADSLLPDGSLINKAGSYLLALAVHDSGVPLYVCCESFKRRKEESRS